MKGRFAPSPTGYLHLGNIWAAMAAYISVRQQQGTFLLRIEDIDRDRSKALYREAILDDLEWLGFTWDEGPRAGGPDSPYCQQERSAIYETILQRWKWERTIYPCSCNRSRLQEISSAPHGGGVPVYDGRCREQLDSPFSETDKKVSWRLAIRENHNICSISFTDRFQGPISVVLKPGIHDFIVKRADGMFAYQLAVAIDDALMGVTEVIRGIDLLYSTPLQLYVMSLLEMKAPIYGHVPLLVDRQGVRLSKRQESISIRELRQSKMTSSAIWTKLCESTGMSNKKYNHITLKDLVEIVSMDYHTDKKEVSLTLTK